jgi:serine/threonine protein kinase
VRSSIFIISSKYYAICYTLASQEVTTPEWGAYLLHLLVLTFPTFCLRSIIYRDIKPDNIGFDVRGDVKIFDFGLSKEFNPDSKDKDGFYQLTSDTGSPRYMATEVALGKPYNETVDVYSFCILLWQILKVETPFDGYTMNMFQKKVITAGTRPACDAKWPKEITDMMRLGWGDCKKRPSMDDICATLRDEIQSKTDEEVDEIMDASRKSEISLHRGF